MRIVCPNCNTGYKIPDRAIPTDGREVQCSSCAHAWYQLPLPESGGVPDAGVAPVGPAVRAPDDEALSEPSDSFPRRQIDPQVLSVLRQEATRETRARQAEAGSGMESQPDLGLRQPGRAQRPAQTVGLRDRLARLQAAERSADVQTWHPKAESPAEGPRRDNPPASDAPAPQDAAGAAGAADESVASKPDDKKPESKSAPERKDSAQSRVIAQTSPRPGLPVALSSTELALIEERKARKGFRLGFGLTAGTCCVLLALYVGAQFVPPDLPGAAQIQSLHARGEAMQTLAAERLRTALETAAEQFIDRVE